MSVENLYDLLASAAAIILILLLIAALVFQYLMNRRHARALQQKNKEFAEQAEAHAIELLKQNERHNARMTELAEHCLKFAVQTGELLAETPGAYTARISWQLLLDKLVASANTLVDGLAHNHTLYEISQKDLPSAVLALIELHSWHHIKIEPKIDIPDHIQFSAQHQLQFLSIINYLILNSHATSSQPKIELEINVPFDGDLILVTYSDGSIKGNEVTKMLQQIDTESLVTKSTTGIRFGCRARINSEVLR